MGIPVLTLPTREVRQNDLRNVRTSLDSHPLTDGAMAPDRAQEQALKPDPTSSEATGALARIVAIPSARWEDISGDVLGVAYEELREELLRRYEPALAQPFEDIAPEDEGE